MLRKIRISLAVLCCLLITLLFLDFTGTAHAWLGWLAKLQFLPAVLALNVGVIIGLVVLTLVCGRVYCSVICPLGVLQDFISWLSGLRGRKQRNRFRYSPEVRWLRYPVLALFIIALLAGIHVLVALLAPYSAYGRIAGSLFSPLYRWANNGLAVLAERVDSYTFYTVDVWVKTLPTLIVAAVTLIVIAVLAWRSGRTWCNTICPVGTVLGQLARFSLLKPVIDASKCNRCGQCARQCKASCINSKTHQIDYSRCVACMDCLGVCHKQAIHYTRRTKATTGQPVATQPASAQDVQTHPVAQSVSATTTDSSRRGFLTTAALLASTAALQAQEKTVDGGLAFIEKKKRPVRATPITPPGSRSMKHLTQQCTACQLCITACPNGVLRPSTDLSRMMQPESSYERGYCRPECTRCSEVCPTGAIRLLDLAEKASTQIGHAVWIQANCVCITDGVSCGNCARHCPAGAILMVPSIEGDETSVKIPAVNASRCIGCGACENLCPARPLSAIYVEGHEVHRTI